MADASRPIESEPPVAALLTPRGRGAVATIRLQGDCRLIDTAKPPLFRAVNGQPLVQQLIGRIVFGRWGDPAPEEVVLCRVADDEVEIHCHGGEAASRRILADLESVGCAIRTWQQWLSETAGIFQAECTEALSRATTRRTAEILLEQQSGRLRKAFESLQDRLEEGKRQSDKGTNCRSRPPDGTWNGQRRPNRLQGPVGPSGPTVRQGDKGNPVVRVSDCPIVWSSASDALEGLLRWAEFGLHLTRPWKIVLAGRPNVGKSSLINALIGYSRSIVYDQPGTTRDVVTAETALEGWPIQFADTAGIRVLPSGKALPLDGGGLGGGDDSEAMVPRQRATPPSQGGEDALESAGIELSRTMLREADCRVLLLDASRPPHEDDRQLLADWPDALLVAHKCDLPNAWGHELPREALPVSALTGEGVEELAKRLVDRLVPEVPPPGTSIPVTPRQIDLLREARDALQRNDESACRDALQRLLGTPAHTQ